jgi:hypothetical protein
MFIKAIAIGGTKVPGKGRAVNVHTQALSALTERQAAQSVVSYEFRCARRKLMAPAGGAENKGEEP